MKIEMVKTKQALVYLNCCLAPLKNSVLTNCLKVEAQQQKLSAIIVFTSILLCCCSTSCRVAKPLPAKDKGLKMEMPATMSEKSRSPEEQKKRSFLVDIGDKAPNITFNLIDGETTSLKDLQKKGEVVMLQFTASWCGVCRKEMPHIESEIWQPYKDKGLTVIGVDLDEPLDKVQAFIEQMKVSYPISLDPEGKIFYQFAQPKSGVTRNVLIDKKGNIVFLTRLFDEAEFNQLKTKITSLLE